MTHDERAAEIAEWWKLGMIRADYQTNDDIGWLLIERARLQGEVDELRERLLYAENIMGYLVAHLHDRLCSVCAQLLANYKRAIEGDIPPREQADAMRDQGGQA